MKVTYRVSDTLTFTVEADTQRKVFDELATIQEVFGENKCGKCGKEDIKYTVRTVDGNDYYEMRCQNKDCRARLSFGLHQQGGTMFAKKKNKEGAYLPTDGWVKWNKTTQQEE